LTDGLVGLGGDFNDGRPKGKGDGLSVGRRGMEERDKAGENKQPKDF